MATKTRKMEPQTLSDEEMEDLFTESFENQVAKLCNIGEWECSCKRDPAVVDVRMEVMVIGLAGSPSVDNFKNDEIADARKVVISREDKGSLAFKYHPKETIALNTNDYILVYKSV